MHMVWSKRWLGGLTFIELLIIITVLAVLAGILLPALSKTRPKTRRLPCVNNLKQVGLGFRIFAADHQGRFPMQVSTNEGGSMEYLNEGRASRHFLRLSNELSAPLLLYCPMDTQRKPATNFIWLRETTISYFVGLDSTELQPQTFLAGDRNLTTNGSPVKPGRVDLTTNMVVGWASTMHTNQGNVAMGDGSVQQFSGPRLAQALRGTGLATNRFAAP
jgi:prepilin-type processing-associated H-X9-DG protein